MKLRYTARASDEIELAFAWYERQNDLGSDPIQARAGSDPIH